MLFGRLTYDEALDVLRGSGKVEPVIPGENLGRHHERALLDYFENYPVFITHYPMSTKAFYMKSSGDRALCFDLIMDAGGEVCGGSLREDNYDILNDKIKKMKTPESLKWYLNLRKIGEVPHGGFGIGVDRLIQSVTGVENIRDVVPFPRWSHHLTL